MNNNCTTCEKCKNSLNDDEWRLCPSCQTLEYKTACLEHISWCYQFFSEDPEMPDEDKQMVFDEVSNCKNYMSTID